MFKKTISAKPFLFDAFIYASAFIFALLCLIPFVTVISGSLSREEDIVNFGYSIIPRHFSLLAYQILFANSKVIFNAYKVTLIVTVVGTLMSILINTMMAYSLSRKGMHGRNFLNVYTLVTILFSGGMVPWYIVCVNYLHLKDTMLALIIPSLANAWYIFLLRNFIQSLPYEIYESAIMDGAGDLTVFFRIILPLMQPAIATIGLFVALNYWNDWWHGLMLIDKDQLKPLQLILRVVTSNIDFMRSQLSSPETRRLSALIPAEGVKMAMCVVTIGPIIFLYPFVQRFFIKGIVVGAVKG